MIPAEKSIRSPHSPPLTRWPFSRGQSLDVSGSRRACRKASSRNASPLLVPRRHGRTRSPRGWPSPSAMTGELLCEGRPDATGEVSHVLPYPSPRSDPAPQRSSGRACRILELATADVPRASRLPITLPTGADWLQEVAREPEFSVRDYNPRGSAETPVLPRTNCSISSGCNGLQEWSRRSTSQDHPRLSTRSISSGHKHIADNVWTDRSWPSPEFEVIGIPHHGTNDLAMVCSKGGMM